MGWHLLRTMDERVSPAGARPLPHQALRRQLLRRPRHLSRLPVVLEQLVNAGHDLYFVTARAERRANDHGDLGCARRGSSSTPRRCTSSPWATSIRTSRAAATTRRAPALYKTRLAKQLSLDVFCEDDEVIARSLADAGVDVLLFDQPWNRVLVHERITRVAGWSDVAQHLGL